MGYVLDVVPERGWRLPALAIAALRPGVAQRLGGLACHFRRVIERDRYYPQALVSVLGRGVDEYRCDGLARAAERSLN